MTERELLEAVAKLLRRAPKAVNSMYVGTDREPWGKQAQALAKQIEEAMNTSRRARDRGEKRDRGKEQPDREDGR